MFVDKQGTKGQEVASNIQSWVNNGENTTVGVAGAGESKYIYML